jgi:hypothetical protein
MALSGYGVRHFPARGVGNGNMLTQLLDANTYRFEQSLNFGLERSWCCAYQKGRQGIAVGFDDGTVVVNLGREEPAVSLDNSGKLVWSKHNEVLSAIIKGGGRSSPANHSLGPCADRNRCIDKRQRANQPAHKGSRHLRSLSPDSAAFTKRTLRQCLRRWRVHYLHGSGLEK